MRRALGIFNGNFRSGGYRVFDDISLTSPRDDVLAALTVGEFEVAGAETRLVEVGESAGSTITLPAAVLRSTALTILGTAGP